jgi:uncharacterized protein YybS (DUF2232 family)
MIGIVGIIIAATLLAVAVWAVIASEIELRKKMRNRR